MRNESKASKNGEDKGLAYLVALEYVQLVSHEEFLDWMAILTRNVWNLLPK